MSHREKKKMTKKNARYNEYVLHEVYSFSTLEDFWRMYNHTYSISEVISNTDYLVFKKGIRPEWEDPQHKDGGKWVVTLPIEDDMEEEVDKAWLQLLLHVIGGLFAPPQRALINGMIFSIRDRHLRISLWCKSATDTETLQAIGHQFREISQLDKLYKFGFQVHKKALDHKLDNQNFITLD